MKTFAKNLNYQRGAASLIVALILLIAITIVVLFTAKTVLVETQITADNYRTTQATAAASAAMDQAIAYFNNQGIDAGAPAYTNDVEDLPQCGANSSASPATHITLTSGSQTTRALFFFNNVFYDPDDPNNCQGQTSPDNTPLPITYQDRAQITARGWSDDCAAVRTIIQCVGTFDVFNAGKGPRQPFVSKAGVGAFGNAKIINRYNNSSIWSGSILDTSGAAFGTYLRPSNTEITNFTKAELDSDNENANTQLVSNRDAGAGIDVISGDPNLTNASPDEFFNMFFSIDRDTLRGLAEDSDQKLAAGGNPNGMTGVIWIGPDGTPSTTTTNIGGTTVIGSPNVPAIMIINGDLQLTGGTIHGVVYVTGEIKIAGNAVIKGSILSESGNNSGAGTLKLVYVPYGGEGSGPTPFIPGTGAVIAGSWRDWN
ncbi:hypothetical protein [Methylotuvimicrobium buryatense]|uniref:Type 4 fimbrial biogenesis protein PilX N-terminal domain-containing protein n=1 Tax=Methylotuvimicrobium buryatense TaxID=95641 RepID=A0A4P9UP42_METBY|nr:hypothetical protein [Methylotuvimicrobium buryatense]QCW83027.1 hypothetical protein EQU24_12850 [Methylotuvimicrobium buryatense]